MSPPSSAMVQAGACTPTIVTTNTNPQELHHEHHQMSTLHPIPEMTTTQLHPSDKPLTILNGSDPSHRIPPPIYQLTQDLDSDQPAYRQLVSSPSSFSTSTFETLKGSSSNNCSPSSSKNVKDTTIQVSDQYSINPIFKLELEHQPQHHQPQHYHQHHQLPQSEKNNNNRISSFMKKCQTLVRNESQEFKLACTEAVQFVQHHDWKLTFRKMFKKKYWGWWLLLLVIIILSSLLSSYHTQIAMQLRPYQVQIKKASWSWIVPTILLIIVSFPPLFGHELIILVSGMIWGLWIGFAIACAGTFLGELATYFAFKHLISRRSQKIEERSVTYSSLAKLMREGGLVMVILVRASAIPGHVCTAMQATIGISFWVFTIACFVTLPKQFALVYVGVILSESEASALDSRGNSSSSRTHQTSHQLISATVFIITAFFTILSAYIVWMRMRKLRPLVQEEFERKKKGSNELTKKERLSSYRIDSSGKAIVAKNDTDH